MLRRVKFIYNPSAGGAIITEYLDRIIEAYQKNGYSIVPYRLMFDAPAEDIISDIDHTYHHILISGGDGTINYIINILKAASVDIPVAILPTGTANDFSTALGMPVDIMKSVETVLSGEVRRVDLGLVNGTYYVNVFSCGLFTDISQKTPTVIKNNFGKLAYYVNGIGELPRFRKMQLSIHTDGGDFEGKALIFFVFNGQTAGTMPIAYLSEIDDGMLDVLIVKSDTRLESLRTMLKHFSRIITRRGVVTRRDYPKGLVHIKCRHVTAESPRNESTDIDGQAGPEFPIDINCVPGGLQVITAPKE